MVIAKRLDIYRNKSWVDVDGDLNTNIEFHSHRWDPWSKEIEEWKPSDSESSIQPVLRDPAYLGPADELWTARDIFGRGNKFLN